MPDDVIYPLIKFIHVSAVMISLSLFSLRSLWKITQNPMLDKRWVYRLPQVNDTVLLTAGILLALTIKQYPLQQDWLTAKLLALFVYIGLGMLVMRGKFGLRPRIALILTAIAVFGYIVGVALSKQPGWFLTLFA